MLDLWPIGARAAGCGTQVGVASDPGTGGALWLKALGDRLLTWVGIRWRLEPTGTFYLHPEFSDEGGQVELAPEDTKVQGQHKLKRTQWQGVDHTVVNLRRKWLSEVELSNLSNNKKSKTDTNIFKFICSDESIHAQHITPPPPPHFFQLHFVYTRGKFWLP